MTDYEAGLDKALATLSTALKEEPMIRSFLQLKETIEHDQALVLLRQEIIANKKLMSQNMMDDVLYFSYKEKYERLSESYDNNPIVINYRALKIEVIDLLKEIKNLLN